MKIISLYRNIVAAIIATILTTTTISAREIYQLNNDWRVFPATKSSGDDAKTVTLPYCWSEDSNIPPSLTSANYLRTIFAPMEWGNKRVFIKFNGVQSVADIFVNGRFVGEHRGGATAFCFEITNFLNLGRDNAVMAIVSAAPLNDILPTSIEHDVHGGINRDVELIVTPQVAISPIFHGSDGAFVTTKSISENNTINGYVDIKILSPYNCERRVELTIKNENNATLHNEIVDPIKVSNNGSIRIPFNSNKISPWSPEDPKLYRVTVKMMKPTSTKQIKGHSNELIKVEDREIDQIEIVTGFRTISLAADGASKGCVIINRDTTFMRGVSLYHDHPLKSGTMTKSMLSSDIDNVEDMGANAIRSAIMPHNRALYEMCDERGIMTWVDTPLSRASFFSDIAYFPTDRFEENGKSQMKEIIFQNYNHPSIIMWGVFSLLTTDRGDSALNYIKELNTLAHAADATRPTVALSNQNGDINNVTDLITWRQDIGWSRGSFSDIALWQQLIHEKWSKLRSGVMYGEQGSIEHQADRNQVMEERENRMAWFPEGRKSEMHETYSQHLAADSLFWGEWLTSMYDYKSPRNQLGERVDGVITFDRERRKDAYYLYRARWNKKSPTLHIADRRSNIVDIDKVTLRVYASDTIPPKLTINGDSETYQLKRIGDGLFVGEDIPVKSRTTVTVEQGELRDEVEFYYKSQYQPEL